MGVCTKYLLEDPKWAWIDELQVGDIITCPSGDMRMVRMVNRHKYNDRHNRSGRVWTITLAIRNCSWTGKGYTVLNRSDIKTRQFSPTGLRGEPLINIEATTCCQVKGLA